MCKAEQLHREGKLPKRICHCDTKVNNMMFDKDGKILCVIDLDTVMPSYVFSDFGDFLRTAANPVAEDSPELDKVDFDMEIFKAFTRGYLKGTKPFLSPIERENLPYAACLFPFMQAVRFFADYIGGDTYYKIKYPEHNLVRTRNQMKLFHSALGKVPQMMEFSSQIVIDLATKENPNPPINKIYARTGTATISSSRISSGECAVRMERVQELEELFLWR